MTLRVRLLPAFFTAGLIAVSMSGCNIFDFAVDAEKTPVEEAQEAIRNGDYDKALSALADSNGVLKDSTDSMALYTYSKALLLKSGLSIARIINLVEAENGTSGTNNALLEEIDNLDFITQTKWYQANVQIAANLAKIRNGSAMGDIDSSDIALDYSISNIMGGMLSLRDTNRDKVINSNDFQINISDVSKLLGGSSGSGFTFDGIIQEQANGDTLKFEGLTAFLGGLTYSKRAKTAVGVSGYTPDNINDLIATFFTFLSNGEDGIISLVQGQSSLDPEELRKYIRQAAVVINYYWYDDNVDNDGDLRFDEETINGVDDDGDGYIDEDTDCYPGDASTPNTQYLSLFYQWQN